MTEELVIKAMTPEERLVAEHELEMAEANSGVCIGCGS